MVSRHLLPSSWKEWGMSALCFAGFYLFLVVMLSLC